MDLKALQAVLAVAHHRNFTRAAEALRIPQPALSAQVRRLEEELGLRLFDRTTRRVVPTQAGSLVASSAEVILQAVSTLSTEIASLAAVRRGLVRIGAHFAVNPGLPGLLAEFVSRFPEVDITLKEANSATMLEMLRARDMDVAFATLSPDLDMRDLQQHVYSEEPFLLIVPPHSELAARVSVTFQQIADTPLIMQRQGSAIRRMVDRSFAAVGRVARVNIESDSGNARTLVARGIGAAIVPESVAYSPGPSVTCVSLVPKLMRVSALVWRSDTSDPAVTDFVTFMLRQPPNAIVSATTPDARR